MNQIDKIQFRVKKSQYGVGLFAIKFIKKDEEIMLNLNGPPGSYYDISDVEAKLSKEHISLLEDYHCYQNSIGKIFIPDDYNEYFTKINSVMFLNHSNTPNIGLINNSAKALRDININEELYVDYIHWCGFKNNKYKINYNK